LRYAPSTLLNYADPYRFTTDKQDNTASQADIRVTWHSVLGAWNLLRFGPRISGPDDNRDSQTPRYSHLTVVPRPWASNSHTEPTRGGSQLG